jgi:lipopolysaccharide export system permease protein
MKKIHLLVLKSYIGPFILTFFLSIFILLMQFLWKYIDDLVGKGIEWNVITELMFFASTTFIPMALPLAILLSSIMTLGNLGERYELVALKASGISLLRTLMPMIIFTIIISISAFMFSNYVLPIANLKMRTLLHDVRNLRPEMSLKEGIFNSEIEGYIIKVDKKNKKTRMLYGVTLYDHTGDVGNNSVTLADSGQLKMSTDQRYLLMTLYNGKHYEEVSEKNEQRPERYYPFRRDIFEKQIVYIEMEGFKLKRSDKDLYKDHYEMLNIKQLENAIDSLKKEYKNYSTKFNSRFSQMNFFKIEKRNFDSLMIAAPTVNIDTVFNKFTLAKKTKTISTAMDYARNAKGFIDLNQEDFKYKNETFRRHEIEWHRKFTLAVACLVLFFIGAPLGAIIRKGGLGMPSVVSVVFFIIYYLISIYGEKSVREGIITSASGMWLSTMILFPLGLFLTYKAASDSQILNIDSYTNFFKKIFKRNKE